MFGTALYAVLPYAHDGVTFAAIMALDNFGIAVAGITLIAYMSSLTSLGYTATQYALLSSAYAWAGKLPQGLFRRGGRRHDAAFRPDERLCRVFHRLRRARAFPRWSCSPSWSAGVRKPPLPGFNRPGRRLSQSIAPARAYGVKPSNCRNWGYPRGQEPVP